MNASFRAFLARSLPRRIPRAEGARLPIVFVAVFAVLLLAFPASRSNAAYPAAAEGPSAAVATENADATHAALETLRAGGNAVDGAITAALTLGVVNPISSGIGGGGFALVYLKKERKVLAFDFRETAPQKIDVERLLAQSGSNAPREQRGHAVGVPGEPAGLELLNLRYGKRSLAADALPAADLAARGFALGRHMTDSIAKLQEYIAVSPDLARVFFPGDHPLGFRSLVRRPELARTLTRFGAEGSRPFYAGDIGKKIVQAAKSAGGTLEESDLTAYRVKERAPLTRTFGSRTVYAMPAPSAGGLMLLEALSIFGADPSSMLGKLGFGSSEYLHMLAEVMRGALADRIRVAGDPDLETSVNEAYERALSADRMAARRQRLDPYKTHPAPEFKSQEQGTSHIVVADVEGNVVSLTTTVNGPFGARIVAGDTGILLNDELTDFSSPSDVSGFGVIGLGPNRARPGARPVSSMTPAIVLENSAPILAVGGSGGMRIASNVMQATLARLVFQMDPGACVSSPRIFVHGASPEVLVDPEIAEDVRAGMRARGEQVREERMLSSSVQMVAWDRRGPQPRLLATADPRKHGFAIAQ
ncbi:gamma-glutamyltransferase family protein [Pendulispora albinea]|uniref:Gamma-glutamyltransferase family protein n=1 Tax=Pendulispora albinea TaxID=2741071 RepID=A0ABZ2LYA6_9BACT